VIHLVAALDMAWAVKYMQHAGADVNLKDNWGCTALHWAAKFGYVSI
jgi:ankyrin repeat protein